MGLFDFVKDTFDLKNEPSENELKQTLQQNGITLQNLDLDVKGDTVRVAGVADTNAEREKAILVLGNRKDVNKVEDSIQVMQPRRANLGTPQQTTAATTGGPTMAGGLGAQAQQPRTPEPDETRFYKVQPGDSLSKIAQQHYGEANKYNQIFEANRPMLKDPDHIYPGQVLRVPPEQ